MLDPARVRSRTKKWVTGSVASSATDITIPNAVINNQSEQIQTTARVFRIAYKEAKHHRSAYGFENEIRLPAAEWCGDGEDSPL